MSAFVDVTVNIDSKPFLVRSDRGYAEAVLQREEFEPGLVKAIKALAEGSKVALDVGANIGCTAILMSSLAEKVLAFEPAPSTFGLLMHNTRGFENIALHNFALGEQKSQAQIQFAPDNRSGGFISETKATTGHAIEGVVIKTLDQFCAEDELAAIDFVKIDTEGYEGHVLRGGADSLMKFKPVVIGEINHWCLNAFQRTSIPDFFDQLRSIFPILLAVDHVGERLASLHDSDSSYVVTYEHIVGGKWSEFIGAFDEGRLARLRELYKMM